MLSSVAVKRAGLFVAVMTAASFGCDDDEKKVVEPPKAGPDVGFVKFSCSCIPMDAWEGYGSCWGPNVWWGCEDQPIAFHSRGKPTECWTTEVDQQSGCMRPVVDPDCMGQCPPRPDSGVAPPPDSGPPIDTGVVTCTCIDMSAWQGFGQCACADIEWGCGERPQTFSACDVPPSCWDTTVDVQTGCVRPLTMANCIEMCAPPADAGTEDAEVQDADSTDAGDDLDMGIVDVGTELDASTSTAGTDAGDVAMDSGGDPVDGGDAPVDSGDDPIDAGEVIDAGTGTVAVDAGEIANDAGMIIDAATSTMAADAAASDSSIDSGATTSTTTDGSVSDAT